MYTYMYVCMYMYIYIYIYVYRRKCARLLQTANGSKNGGHKLASGYRGTSLIRNSPPP